MNNISRLQLVVVSVILFSFNISTQDYVEKIEQLLEANVKSSKPFSGSEGINQYSI